MRYMKLIEQFDWDNDPFGEDYVDRGEDLMQLGRYRTSREFYIVEKFFNDKVILYDSRIYNYLKINDFDFNSKIEYGDKIIIHNKNIGHEEYTWKKLPQEIKNIITNTKLFEQNWWENAKGEGEKIPALNINGICMVRTGQITFYVAEKIVEDCIHLYDNCPNKKNYYIGNNWDLAKKEEYITENVVINIYDSKISGFRNYYWKNLPQEIKDKLT